MKSVVLFDNFGPYHVARLKAVAELVDLAGVQFGADSSSYQWEGLSADFKTHTLNPSGTSWHMTRADFQKRLFGVLDQVNPDVVFVPGWATPGPLLALKWCLQKRIPPVIMSESTARDAPRVFLREIIKRYIVSLASSALVGGRPQRDYLIQLGMSGKRIFLGYNMVDNDFFISRSDFWRDQVGNSTGPAEPPYFLASNRFIAKKNLFLLLDSYAAHIKCSSSQGTANPWPFVLLGDGELKDSLVNHVRKLGLPIEFSAPWECSANIHSGACVYFPGFRQIDELPRFYAGAGAFVHASLSEQWGLVVNEAMASRLPVIVSESCGCAIDLVAEGENGYTFVASDSTSLTQLLLKISNMDSSSRTKMGERSREIIHQWGAKRFAEGFMGAAETALRFPPKGPNPIAQVILTMFCRRLIA
jgi:glycosyltransferase involved in cell wall biosynthesis